MQQVIANYVDNRTYMGAVLVAEDAKVLLNQGYGFADLEWNIPDTPKGRFRIGSLTKQFTAACILLLAEHGKLKLDDPIKTYLPDAPPAWDKVTLYNLLTHSSGIPNFTGGPAWDAYKWNPHTPDETITLFRNRPLDFAPGEKFAYSNSNYILLGRIIEKASGLSYEQFLQENILCPLGMRDTGVDHDTAILPQRVRGYNPVPGGFAHALSSSMTIPYAAGFLYSTTDDLFKWEQGLFGGKVLSAASLKKMTTPYKGGYAMGLFVLDAKHHGVITHNGSIDGFEDSLNYYPEKKLTIIVLGNVRNQVPDRIAEQLGKVAYGEKVVVTSDRRQVPVAPALLQEYAGSYKSSSFALTIQVEGDHLLSITPNGRKVALYPESQTKFFIKEFDAQVEFVRDPATQKVTKMVVTQDDNIREVPRKP
jgi:CubicO group peptidase (beta-lactamase class C family)